MEDEWFIVSLLFELSRHDDSLVIQVQDTDGEFLLIEASEHLNVKPEWAENRTFIHKGQLHLINRSDWPDKISPHETRQAIEFIRKNTDKTTCDQNVQQQIHKRIGDYPQKISKLTHKARVSVPVKVAALIDLRPQLISSAVRAFFCRDEQDLVFCRRMKHFGPIGLVDINVRMTKFNYAQLCGQELKPDKRLQWPDSPGNRKSRDLGFKLSCGFEILLSTFEQKQLTSDAAQPVDTSKSSANEQVDKRWQSFLQSLQSNGYFGDLMENSKGYNHKLKEAHSYFIDFIRCNGNEEIFFDPDFLAGKSIHESIIELASTEQFCNDQLSDEESDQWMYEPPDYFVEMEKSMAAKQLGNNIPDKLEEFINIKSDHKGAVLPERKQTLKERAMQMISSNLKSILQMKVSDSEQDDSESDLDDYGGSSDEEERPNKAKKSKKEEKKEDDGGQVGEDQEMREEPVLRIKHLMAQMDQELSETCMAQSFERTPKTAPLADDLEEFDESEDEGCSIKATDGGSERGMVEDLPEVDLRFNAVRNILESFQSQNGLPGPSSNLLSSMGVHLPRDSQE